MLDINKENSKILIKSCLATEDYFIVDISIVSFGNHGKIIVIVDRGNDFTIDDCSKLIKTIKSRTIYKRDTSTPSYTLEISSLGTGTPIRLGSQYKKTENRMLSVTLKNQSVIRGILQHVSAEDIHIATKKKAPQKMASIPITQIKKALVQNSFR